MNKPKYRTANHDHYCAQCKQLIPRGTLHVYDRDHALRYHIACTPEKPTYTHATRVGDEPVEELNHAH